MFIESWPFPLSVPDDVFEPPVLALPKLTRRVPVPGVLLALRTVNVTLNCEPMFTRAGPLKDTTLPSANVIDVPCGGGAVGTGVRAGVGTGVPPGRCVGAGVPLRACDDGGRATADDEKHEDDGEQRRGTALLDARARGRDLVRHLVRALPLRRELAAARREDGRDPFLAVEVEEVRLDGVDVRRDRGRRHLRSTLVDPARTYGVPGEDRMLLCHACIIWSPQ